MADIEAEGGDAAPSLRTEFPRSDCGSPSPVVVDDGGVDAAFSARTLVFADNSALAQYVAALSGSDAVPLETYRGDGETLGDLEDGGDDDCDDEGDEIAGAKPPQPQPDRTWEAVCGRLWAAASGPFRACWMEAGGGRVLGDAVALYVLLLALAAATPGRLSGTAAACAALASLLAALQLLVRRAGRRVEAAQARLADAAAASQREVGRALRLLKEMELAARGYRLSRRLPPIERLDYSAPVPHLHCRSLRATLVRSLQAQLDVTLAPATCRLEGQFWHGQVATVAELRAAAGVLRDAQEAALCRSEREREPAGEWGVGDAWQAWVWAERETERLDRAERALRAEVRALGAVVSMPASFRAQAPGTEQPDQVHPRDSRVHHLLRSAMARVAVSVQRTANERTAETVAADARYVREVARECLDWCAEAERDASALASAQVAAAHTGDGGQEAGSLGHVAPEEVREEDGSGGQAAPPPPVADGRLSFEGCGEGREGARLPGASLQGAAGPEDASPLPAPGAAAIALRDELREVLRHRHPELDQLGDPDAGSDDRGNERDGPDRGDAIGWPSFEAAEVARAAAGLFADLMAGQSGLAALAAARGSQVAVGVACVGGDDEDDDELKEND